MSNSSDRTSGDQMTAVHYNDLRKDVRDSSSGHGHDGTEGVLIALDCGDGSDGDVVISGDTTLTRSMFYNNLTVNNGYNLIGAGFLIFVKGTCTNNGTIHNNGVTATTSGGAAGGAAGYFRAGGSGGATVNGNGASTTNSLGGAGGASGGTGGTVTAPTHLPRSVAMFLGSIFNSSGTPTANGGWSGGGGGSASSGAGGGGGGGVLGLIARILINNGTISCKGGSGYSASGNSGGGGGGFLFIGYRKATWGTESVAGGTGPGNPGAAGTLIKVQL